MTEPFLGIQNLPVVSPEGIPCLAICVTLALDTVPVPWDFLLQILLVLGCTLWKHQSVGERRKCRGWANTFSVTCLQDPIIYCFLYPQLFKLTAFEWLVGPGKEVLDFRMLCDNSVIAASMSPCTSLPLWHPFSTRSSGRTVCITLRDSTQSSVSVTLLVPKEVFVITELSLSLWCRCPRCLAGVFHNLHLGCSHFIVHWRVSLL